MGKHFRYRTTVKKFKSDHTDSIIFLQNDNVVPVVMTLAKIKQTKQVFQISFTITKKLSQIQIIISLFLYLCSSNITYLRRNNVIEPTYAFNTNKNYTVQEATDAPT